MSETPSQPSPEHKRPEQERAEHKRAKSQPLTVPEFQRLIEAVYGEKDRARGIEGTFLWFHEEVGELTRAIRRGHDIDNLKEEFADVFAWLVSMASMLGVDMQEAVEAKYGAVFQEAGLRG